jgi:hypothetical protein
MMEMRQRVVAQVQDGVTPLASLPVSGLLDALRVSYQQGGAWEVAAITEELLDRMSEAPGGVRIKAQFTEC